MSDFDIYPEYSTDISKFITLSNVNGICIWNVKILYLRSSEIFILNKYGINSHFQYISKVVVVCLFSKQKTQSNIMLKQLQFQFYVHNSTIVYIGGYVSG